MTELRILEILTRNASTNNADVQNPPHLSKLLPHCVQSISKNISDILYESLTTKSASQGNKRLDILLLLRKWCANTGNHLKINGSNYDCLIEPLIKVTSSLNEADVDLQARLKLDDSETKEWDVTASVIQYYEKLETINAKKVELLEIIRKRDRIKCRDEATFEPNTSVNLKQNEFSRSFPELMVLNKKESCDKFQNVRKVSDEGYRDFRVQPNENLREKQVDLAYALLNLKKSNNDIALLSNVLKSLSCYDTLQLSEVKFVVYLWENCEKLDLPPEIPRMLLEKFKFIYEKSLITICTDALTSCSIPVTVPNQLQKILKLSLGNDKVRYSIRSLLYELFACSGYDSRLQYFLTLIR